MAMIAMKCPTYKVHVVDINREKIAAWNSDNLPIYEPGLEELVLACRDKNLFFTTQIEDGVREADIIFVSVNTPTKTFGVGAGQAADLQYWEKTARMISEISIKPTIVVEKSTLPVRTAEAMATILRNNSRGIPFEVVSNPEFLAEGSAINDLLHPDRVLIGADESSSGRKALDEVAEIYEHWVPKNKILRTNVWSSELSKLVNNAFLAQRISSINSVSAICEATGANIDEVANAIGTDSRIGSKFLKTSVGFGGSCFKKDILNLVYIARSYGLEEVAIYWEQVVAMNDYQQARFVRGMLKNMFNTLAGKKIALFGFAFKANTGDTRESPALFVARELLQEHAEIVISDPKAIPQAQIDVANLEGNISFQIDPYEAAKGSHAVAVLTEWDLYRSLDYQAIFESMLKPASIFDGRNILAHEDLNKMGFRVYPIGKAPLIG